MSTLLTAPSISIWNTTRDAVARSEGELFTTIACTGPRGSSNGQCRDDVRISPQHSSQFSAKTPCIAATTGPSMRTIVSRQVADFFSGCSHQSATPAPPVNATLPSTTISSRCVRLFSRCSLYHRIGW